MHMRDHKNLQRSRANKRLSKTLRINRTILVRIIQGPTDRRVIIRIPNKIGAKAVQCTQVDYWRTYKVPWRMIFCVLTLCTLWAQTTHILINESYFNILVAAHE